MFIFIMKALTFLLLVTLTFMFSQSPSSAQGKLGAEIVKIDFYPSGAKFTFSVEPSGQDGSFNAEIPGAFNVGTVKAVNPENIYGDIQVKQLTRERWIPEDLEELNSRLEKQRSLVNSLSARKNALEQTLTLLKNSNPDKSKPEVIITFITDAQALRLKTENDLVSLNASLAKEQAKLRLLTAELDSKRPVNDMSYIIVTGQAKETVYIEAFTPYASWGPKYTLNLDSVTGNVGVKMYVRAFQKTGLNYTGEITLHTKTPDERITTPELYPLKVGIKPREEVIAANSMVSLSRNNNQFKSARRMAMREESEMLEDTTDFDEAAAPMLQRVSVNETLADRTLDIKGTLSGDGTERDFEVIMNDLTLKGKIIITLIPEHRNNAWIVASMDENNEHLIPGQAELRVDNHTSGKIYLDEYGKNGTGQKEIPFGYADQITVKKTSLVGKTGVSWFSGVFTSGYKLEITNGTKDDHLITLKDRLPIPTDEKIKLDVKRIEPREKERDKENRLTWEINVPAGATVPVIVDYTLSYPSGEELQYTNGTE